MGAVVVVICSNCVHFSKGERGRSRPSGAQRSCLRSVVVVTVAIVVVVHGVVVVVTVGVVVVVHGGCCGGYLQ